MRWLVTGAGGQLGHHLTRLLGAEDAVCCARAQLDITNASAVDDAIRQHRPDVVVNAAAYTAVDAAESDEATALTINRDGPANLARALAHHGGRLIHVSTDYVFDGGADRPYAPDDPPNPQTAYGRTKLAGELAVEDLLPARTVIVRTAWVYGGPGRNFVDTMRRLVHERDLVDVVADQIGSPTYVGDLAAALVCVGNSSVHRGTFHYVNSGRASWADLARATFHLLGADPGRVRNIATSDLDLRAPRPRWSVLSTAEWEAAQLPAPRSWMAGLSQHLQAS